MPENIEGQILHSGSFTNLPMPAYPSDSNTTNQYSSSITDEVISQGKSEPPKYLIVTGDLLIPKINFEALDGTEYTVRDTFLVLGHGDDFVYLERQADEVVTVLSRSELSYFQIFWEGMKVMCKTFDSSPPRTIQMGVIKSVTPVAVHLDKDYFFSTYTSWNDIFKMRPMQPEKTQCVRETQGWCRETCYPNSDGWDVCKTLSCICCCQCLGCCCGMYIRKFVYGNVTRSLIYAGQRVEGPTGCGGCCQMCTKKQKMIGGYKTFKLVFDSLVVFNLLVGIILIVAAAVVAAVFICRGGGGSGGGGGNSCDCYCGPCGDGGPSATEKFNPNSEEYFDNTQEMYILEYVSDGLLCNFCNKQKAGFLSVADFIPLILVTALVITTGVCARGGLWRAYYH